ncbi:MAG: NAD-dependent epimerase/dehydratase family protein [Pseudomonadota bacterium]
MQFNANDIVLVTGATGFTGIHLVKKLCASGARVRAIARASSDRSELNDLNIEWFIGDVFDEATVAEAVKGVTTVFHVAAAYREAKISDEVYWNVHVKSTHLLAKQALAQPNFKRFLHVSTIGVHGHIEEPPADEEYRFAPGDEYQTTKVEAEEWIKDFAKTNELPLTVVRPAGIYGPGDRRLLKVFKMAKLPVTPILGFGCQNLYHLIHVDDLTDFMIVAAQSEKTLGEVYICGNSSAISFKDMVKIIANNLNRKARFLRLPVTPFFILGDLCELICKPFGIEPPIYRRRVAFFNKDRSFDTSKMTDHTGFECRLDNEQGITELTQWYQKQDWL